MNSSLTDSKQMKKVLFNVSNIVKGGAVQAAINFIRYSSTDETFEWYYLLNNVVYDEMVMLKLNVENFIKISTPAKNKKVVKKILDFERNVQPDIVLTLFGPAYINFSAHHVSGFANGWVTHSNRKSFYNTYSGDYLSILRSLMKYVYYGFQIRKANAWVLETNVARDGFIKRLKVKASNTYVIPNAAIDFGTANCKQGGQLINGKELKFDDSNILALSANYPHKNLKTLINVAAYLKHKLGLKKFKFLFTLSKDDFYNQYLPHIINMDVEDHICNLGTVNVTDIPLLYSVSRLSILPSFIETFSAVYPESFVSETPLITTDAEFSRDICGEAALYIDPLDIVDISQAVALLLNNKNLCNKLVRNGREVYSKMLKPKEKFLLYVDVIKKVLDKL